MKINFSYTKINSVYRKIHKKLYLKKKCYRFLQPFLSYRGKIDEKYYFEKNVIKVWKENFC